MTWRDRAACIGIDTEIFFATAPRGAHRRDGDSAKRVCRVCPVADECLEWAIEHPRGTPEQEQRRESWRRANGRRRDYSPTWTPERGE